MSIKQWRGSSQDKSLPADTPSHQEFYKEPFEKADGYGYKGVLTISNENTHVQCHICGLFFTSLGNHIQKRHTITTREYKIQYGLRLSKGLVSPKYRQQLKQRVKNARLDVKSKRYAGLQKGAEILKNNPKKQQMYMLENKNIRGTCPEQLLDKVKAVYEKYGADAGLNAFRKEYGAGKYVEAIYKTYGSWKNAVEIAGYSVNSPKKPMTKQQFRAITLDYYDRHKEQPTYRDFYNRNELPSHTVMYRLYGNYNNAIQEIFNPTQS